MRSLNSDTIFVGISVLIIATFSSLLYFDLTKRLSHASAQEIGTITFKKRVAQRKYSGQVLWESVEQNMTVYNNDTIRTEDISEAVVHLKDGTSISLDENSMILLSMDENAINIDFTQGSIFAKRGDLQGNVKEITIQSKDAKVSIEKSDIQLTKTDTTDLDLTVTGGSAKVKIGDKDQLVGKDEKLTVAMGAKEGKIVKLQLKQISPEPNKHMVTSSDSLDVTFTWEPVEAETELYLDIANDKNFKDKISARRVQKSASVEVLQPGSYYWQLRAVNPKDGTVEVSGGRKLSIIQDIPVQLFVPENKKVFTYTAQPPIVNFRWSASEIANDYLVEIAKDASFKSMVKSVDTKLTAIAVIDLDAGDYFWRVRSKLQIGTTSQGGTSNILQFTVKKLKEIAPPELISPQNNRTVSIELINKKEMIFSWRSDARFNDYRLVISKDKEFKDVIVNTAVNKNFYTLEKDLTVGSYFWKVQPVSSADESAPFSVERKFSVISADRLKLIAPVQNSNVTLKDDQKEMPVQFTWEQSKIEGNYKIELSSDKSFSTMLDQKIVAGTAVTYPALKAGKYFWRIRLLDEEKNQIIVSDIGDFSISPSAKELQNVAAAEKVKADAEKAKVDAEKEKEKEKELVKGTTLIVVSPINKSIIYVNGKMTGRGMAKVNAIPGALMSIVVKTPGYEEVAQEVRLAKGEIKTVNISLIDKKLMTRVRWKTNLQSAILAKPIVEKDIIVVTTNLGQVVALNKFGTVLWRQSLSSISKGTPVVNSKSVYVGTVDSNFYALELSSGKVKWKQALDGPLLFGATPLPVNGKIFVATSLGKIQAFSDDGKELWKREMAAGIFSSMDHAENLIFVGTDQSVLYALDDEDGDTDWDFQVDDRIISSSPKFYKGNVYAGTYRGTFYAVDAQRGRLKWKFDAKKSIFSNPSFNGDSVYIGSSDGTLYALNANSGKLLWDFKTGGKIMAEPDFLKDEIFITSDKSIFSLKTDSGKMSWVEHFGERINTAASIIEEDICIGMDNGDVVSLRSNIINVVK